ncbi:MAG: pirin family protein [Gammaproteobacteria bacterium]|nr:pirin family protein [Gammaproteobacteria bacterium]
MIQFRDRMARGASRTGWLDSRHTFSFGGYRDPLHMGFRSLRVLNEDRVIPGAGFSPHSHRDMDIVSIVLDGVLEHRDDLGHGTQIRPGDLQRMSAGTGITHSEFNPSTTQPVHFLQIWIVPDRMNLPPSYEQKTFTPERDAGTLMLVASPDGRAGSLTVHQNALLYRGHLRSGQRCSHAIGDDRGAWLQVLGGIVSLNGVEMREGDGAALVEERMIDIGAETDADVLLFDLG